MSLHNTHRATAHATENVCAPFAEIGRCIFARNFSAGLLRDWALKYTSKQGSFGTLSGHRAYINQQLKDDLVATNQGVVGSIPASRTRIYVLEQRVSSTRANPFFFAAGLLRDSESPSATDALHLLAGFSQRMLCLQCLEALVPAICRLRDLL